MLFKCQLSRGEFGEGWALNGKFHVSSDEVLNRLAGPLVRLYAALMLDLDVMWDAPFPEGPKIIAPNHPSTTDPFLITTLVREPTSILIDDRLFKVPLFGRYLHMAGHIPVVPGRGREAFEAARRLLEAGKSIVIFPEGGVSPLDGGLRSPRTGAARLALLTGAPIVPVGISLQRERIRVIESKYSGISATGRWYLRGPYAITVGKPARLQGDAADRGYVRRASEQLLHRIGTLANRSACRLEASRSFVTVPAVCSGQKALTETVLAS